MIYALNGKIDKVCLNFIVIAVAGGEFYKVFISATDMALLKEGQNIKLFTCLFSKEDGMNLYGFVSEEEKKLFEMLNTVSGVGPKAAMGILGLGEVKQIRAAIKEGRSEVLTKSFGVGKKTAERIIIELKDKISEEGELIKWDEDVYDALIRLGYRRNAAKEAIKKISKEADNVNDKLKEALRHIR